jgi:hypothetical protein
LITVFLLQVRPFSPATPYRLAVPMQSDTAGRARLMWRSVMGTVTPEYDSVMAVKGAQVLTFNLPDTALSTFSRKPRSREALDAIRLDPLDRMGRVVIGTATLLGPEDQVVATFQPSDFLPSKSVLKLKMEDGAAAFTTLPNEGVLFTLKQQLQLPRRTIPIHPVSAALQFCSTVIAMLVALTLAGRVSEERRARIRAALAKARDDQAAWPAVTLFLAAVLATAASCYPVIFCGKTFISPNYGPTQMLQNTYPELVQPPHEVLESNRGTDTGATLWAHLPYSVIEHRAIFGHGELPLWNRNTYCGGPLLGQGMSMLGDPLHWIPITAGGAIWAWDVKFCIAKLLFSLGVGLLAYHATRRIWLAALLAVSSSFIGFFTFRFDHCAYFSLCYAPWILLCWLRAARTTGRVWPWALALAAANFWELNSGTAKESAMLIAFLNITGGLLVLTAEGGWRKRITTLALMNFGNVLFVMLSAPHWMVFLDALRISWSYSAETVTSQLPPDFAIGLFDDLFFNQINSNEILFNPSMNFLILLGCLWAGVDLRRLLRDRTFVAVLLGALLPAALAFGVIPKDTLLKVPFIGKIGHVANTFSCVLIIHLFILAGFGLRSLWDRSVKGLLRGDTVLAAILLALLTAIYFSSAQAVHDATHAKMSGFFRAYAAALIAVLLAMPWIVRGLRLRPSAGHFIAGGLCLFLIHFRHGLWTDTKFDRYVVNPRTRTDLSALPPAIAAIREPLDHNGQPARVVGINGVLAPGFNAVLNLEHFNGADALISPWQHELEEKSEILLMWGWRCVVRRTDFPRAQVFGDLWNVRWYLGTANELPRHLDGLELVKTLDLDIYVSHSAWPRAFFTNRLAECSSLDNFVELLGNADGRPFAALVPAKPTDAEPAKPESLDGRTVTAATAYRLTENTTAFTITAPTPGVAVLGNSYEPGNWRVTLDGRPVDCFRVNHAFLGVAIPEAGTHRLRFAYWPRLLTPALWLSAAGLVGVLLTLMLGIFKRSRTTIA